jgi:hypothetical protein
MTPEEIISEIGTIQDDLQHKIARVHGLAQGLYRSVRKTPADDDTAIYITYANAWMRFAGMAHQGVSRTASTSKILRRLAPKVEESPQKLAKSTPKKSAIVPEATPVESLITMYGEAENLTVDSDAADSNA